MKRDQYFPHDVSLRGNSEIIQLIEEQGMAGYGIYLGLMEYLRTQDDYIGKLSVLKSLSRQLRTKFTRLLKVVNNYDLFVCEESTFYSPKMNEVMKPLEAKRKRIEAYKRKKYLDNLLEIRKTNDIVSNIEKKDKEKNKKRIKKATSST